MGLAAAVVVDSIITIGMCYYLRRNKSAFSTYAAFLLPCSLCVTLTIFLNVCQYERHHRHLDLVQRPDRSDYMVRLSTSTLTSGLNLKDSITTTAALICVSQCYNFIDLCI